MFVEHEKREVFPNRESSQPVLDDASKLLLKAAALLEERGWCQEEFQDGDAFCAIGALQFAAIGKAGEGIDPKDNSFRAACDRLERGISHGTWSHVPSWNDRPGRTQAEVVAKLRAVALGG